MQTLPYRRWSPPASPLRIEFPEELARKLWPEPDALEISGKLYGVRYGAEVHVMAAQAGHAREVIGIFVARVRGEVFLTESNLALFERNQATIALVRAGNRAGFFVREPNGSIQTVRSHEEFSIEEPAPPVITSKPSQSGIRKPSWAPAACFALTLPLLAFFRPAPAFGLKVHENAGQLQISWQPGQPALLEIQDGERRVAVPVFANQSNLTYTRNGAQVDVSLTREDGTAHPPSASARFVAGARPAR
jgi:hypothetical protein